VAVVEEGAVAVDVAVGALEEDAVDAAGVEAGDELGAARFLHAVDRPEDLRQTVEVDHVADLLSRMICREAAVVARVPVARGNDEIECPLHAVCDGDDGVAALDGECAAGNEVVLKIDEDQRAFAIHDGRPT
jgi:hypothetical protein